MHVPIAHAASPAALDLLTSLAATSAPQHPPGTVFTLNHDTTALTLDVTTPAGDLPQTLVTLAQLLTTPAYDTDRCRTAVETYRFRDTGRRRAAPLGSARKALLTHCYGATVLPETPASAAPLPGTPEELFVLHRHVLRPKGSFLVLVGDLDPDTVLADLPAALTHWSALPPTSAVPPPSDPLAAPRLTGRGIVHVERLGAVQSQILLAAPAVGPTDARFSALSLACCLLGGSFSARLAVRLREELALTYGVSVSIERHRAARFILVKAATATATTEQALRELRRELGRACGEEPPSAVEVRGARDYVLGATAVSVASQVGMVELLTHALANGFTPNWLDEYPRALCAVSVDDVRRTLREFCSPDRFSGVVIGDRATWKDAENSTE